MREILHRLIGHKRRRDATHTPQPVRASGDTVRNSGGSNPTAIQDGQETASVTPGPSTDRPIEVCYLINHLAPDGAPTVVESLVEEIGADDIEFTVCFFGGDDTLQSNLEAAGARVRNFGATTDYPQFDPRSLPAMVDFFSGASFDILHCHLPYAQTLGRLVAHLGDIDHVVSTQHNVPSNYHPVERVAERATRRLDAATVAVSGGVESAFTGAEPTAPTERGAWGTIQNGIDVEAFAASVAAADGGSVREEWDVADADPLFVNIARYQPQKDQMALIEAMDRVADTLPSAHLLVVGWGTLEAELRAAVRERGLTDSVTVTGRVPEIHGYYAAADAFVLSSEFEGLPVTLLEAMAAGCPVVATDIPGVTEVVVDGETGRLVPPGDHEGLAEALLDMGDATRREAFGAAGRERVEGQFSVERMADDHVELYRSLARG
jgi:glycosyltransferase involved in cell wall biosynthesis